MESACILFLLGLVSGLVSSFLGVGSGFLVVPCLYWLYPTIPPQVTIATSLGIIFLNSLMNIRNFLRASIRPEWPLAFLLVLFMGLGAFFGGHFSFFFHPSLLKLILAILLLYNGVMVFSFTRMKDLGPSQKFSFGGRVISFAFIIFAGFLAGLTGVGGGVVILPILFKILGVPYTKLPLYSNMAMMGSTLVGTVSYILIENQKEIFKNVYFDRFQWGQFNGTITLCIFAGALFTGPLGVYLRNKTPEDRGQYIFSTLLFFLSLRLFLDIIQHSFLFTS